MSNPSPQKVASTPTPEEREEEAVRQIGNAIGYGRVMQLCEKIWNKLQPGGAHSTGPCVALLVPCPHEPGQRASDCDWCCGSGRITGRVLKALRSSRGDLLSEYEKALEDILDPLSYLRRRAEAEGNKLSGSAYAISNDIGCLKSIAREALQSSQSALTRAKAGKP